VKELIDLLKKHDIKYIISIDDEWEKDLVGVSDEKEWRGLLKNKGINIDILLEQLCEDYGIVISDTESTIIHNESLITVEDLFTSDYPEAENIKQKVMGVIAQKNEVDASLNNLKSIMDEIRCQVPLEIHLNFELSDELTRVNGNAVFILDQDMGQYAEGDLLSYIKKLLSTRINYEDIIVVYTNKVSNLFPHEKKVEYIQKEYQDDIITSLKFLYHLWPIEKVVDKAELTKNLIHEVSKSLYGKSLYKLIDMKRVARDKAFEELMRVSIDEFEEVFTDSYIEGTKVIDVYDQLTDSLINKHYIDLFEEESYKLIVEQLLEYEYRRIEDIKQTISKQKEYDNLRKNTFKKELEKSKQVNSYMKYDVADYSINNRYENIGFGDLLLFKQNVRDEEWSAGINISQECDNILRIQTIKKGVARKNKTYTILKMVAKEIAIENLDELYGKKNDSIWPIEIDKKYYALIPTHDIIRIDTDIVDLCSLNPDGKSSLNANLDEALRFKAYHSKPYFKDFLNMVNNKIKSRFDALVNNDDLEKAQQEAAISMVEADNDTIKIGLYKDLILSLSFQVGYNEDGFMLMRICRVESKRSLRLAYYYLNDLGRIGIDTTPGI